MTVSANTFSLDQILAMIDNQASQYGLSADQINAAKAVAVAEGAGGQEIGDNGTSFGPFQFHAGGMLDGFAQWLHDQGYTASTLGYEAAGTYANENPAIAIRYALEPGGYLNSALQSGTKAGNGGLNLALYAEQFGQRAAQAGGQLIASVYANVVNGWSLISGQSASAPAAGSAGGASKATPTAAPAAATQPTWTIAPGINIPLPDLGALTSDKSGNPNLGLGAISTSISQGAQAIAAVPVAINNAVSAFFKGALRVGWVALGLVLVLLGFWLVGRNSGNQQ